LDSLPLGKNTESVLRLDHIQPVGDHHTYYEALPHQLSEDAITVIDEWIEWLLTGQLPDAGTLAAARSLLLPPQET
jgi:hypothetical protein